MLFLGTFLTYDHGFTCKEVLVSSSVSLLSLIIVLCCHIITSHRFFPGDGLDHILVLASLFFVFSLVRGGGWIVLCAAISLFRIGSCGFTSMCHLVSSLCCTSVEFSGRQGCLDTVTDWLYRNVSWYYDCDAASVK